MNLSEPLYFLFLGLVFLLYYALIPGRPRRLLLLIASYFFYFEVSRFYVLVLLLVTAVTYVGALFLRSPKAAHRQGTFFGLILLLVLIPLLCFKYLGPFLLIAGDYLPVLHPMQSQFMAIALPVGISFFTFVALGYLVDVYLEVAEPEQCLERVGLLLAFFPLITAGPIERATLMSQFDLDNKFSADKALSGLKLILIGLVLKIIFAGSIGVPADLVFDSPGKWSSLGNLIGLIDFTFFVYADFAGYSLIAIGSALMFGLRVRPNFQEPFLSPTVPEFWRHWHMSLSFWVRDYIFSPLRTNWRRSPKLGMAAALFISIVTIGVWHGAKWGYLAFGLMHGTMVVASSFTLARRDAFWRRVHFPPRLLYVIRVLITLSLVMLTFVAFRAATVTDAMVMYRHLFSFELFTDLLQAFHGVALGLPPSDYRILFLILMIIAGDILVRRKITIDKFPIFLQWILYSVAIIEIAAAWLNAYVPHPFVYNKF